MDPVYVLMSTLVGCQTGVACLETPLDVCASPTSTDSFVLSRNAPVSDFAMAARVSTW